MPLVEPDAGGASDAFEDQRRFELVRGHLSYKPCLDLGSIIQSQLSAFAQRLRFGPRRIGGSRAVVGGEAATRNGFRHRLATRAAHWMALAINQREEPAGRRNRQPAVITGFAL